MRFYFNVREQDSYLVDDEGLELEGIAAARNVALAGARSIIASEALQGRIPLQSVIEVKDSAGSPVLDLPFAEAVEFSTFG